MHLTFCRKALQVERRYPRVQEQIQVFVQQSLVLLVPHAELLQEQMSVPDDLLHLHIVLQTDGRTDGQTVSQSVK